MIIKAEQANSRINYFQIQVGESAVVQYHISIFLDLSMQIPYQSSQSVSRQALFALDRKG